jgi:hypothetical protein
MGWIVGKVVIRQKAGRSEGNHALKLALACGSYIPILCEVSDGAMKSYGLVEWRI